MSAEFSNSHFDLKLDFNSLKIANMNYSRFFFKKNAKTRPLKYEGISY